MNLDADAVLALAPDAASAKAARGLVVPAKWPTLGADDTAVWGECQGSGAKPYQTQVDLSGPSFRCSCPSRKFPCKHGLALMLLKAEVPARFTGGSQPAWVSEWLVSRVERAQKKEEKQREAAAAPVDPEAAARAAAKRWSRIEAATQELQRWLADQLRRGLGNLGPEQRGDWQSAAARLVDAQAPGLAQRLGDAVNMVGDSEQAGELLQRLGLLQLACEAVQRRASLPEPAQADLRTLLGWPLERADVLAAAQPVSDRWLVLGQIVEEREGRLMERRVWLHGERSGCRALLLDHAFGDKGFEQLWTVGSACEMALAFYPGAAPLRALVTGEVAAQPTAWPAAAGADEWQRAAGRVAASPWTPLHPMLWSTAVPRHAGGAFWLDADGRRLRLRIGEDDGWSLLACAGGHALAVSGEWDGRTLRPLAARGVDGNWLRTQA